MLTIQNKENLKNKWLVWREVIYLEVLSVCERLWSLQAEETICTKATQRHCPCSRDIEPAKEDQGKDSSFPIKTLDTYIKFQEGKCRQKSHGVTAFGENTNRYPLQICTKPYL